MQLIESYLFQVGEYLPTDQRADILSELRSQLEDEVLEEAGDNPSKEQIETILNRYGHPINVASGYREPRFLIGPELYPAFVETLSTIFTVSLIAVVSFQLLTWVTSGWTTGLSGLVYKIISLSLWLIGAIVIWFATLEHYGERVGWYDNWKASSLPLHVPEPMNRSDLSTNVITEGLFLLWWNSILKFQNWIPGSEERVAISLADTWAPLYWPINLLVGLWFVVHAITLFRRYWTPTTLKAELALSALGILVCLYLIAQPELISISTNIEGAELIERSVRVTILVIAAFIAWDGWQAFTRWRAPA